VNKEKLEKGPPLMLLGMTCFPILVTAMLPYSFWGYIGMVALGGFALIVVTGSFDQNWDKYETMGAFVTLGTIWFTGLVWVPLSWWWLRFLLGFLFLTGIAAKFKQIDHINNGLGADLRKSQNEKSQND